VNRNPNPSENQTGTPDTPPADQPVQGQAPAPLPSPNGTPASTGDRPGIPAEPSDDRISVGAGGILSIPAETGDDLDDDDEEDVQAVGGTTIRERKPSRRLRVIFNPALRHPTKLLVHKPNGDDSPDEELYWIDKPLRKYVRRELRDVLAMLYYIPKLKTFRVWLLKRSPGNSYYDSLHDKLLKQPDDFFEKYEVRVAADTDAKEYVIRRKPRSVKNVPWPTKPMDQIVGEALGPDRIIRSKDHPIIADFAGEEVVE
jgi:hypothetical protein